MQQVIVDNTEQITALIKEIIELKKHILDIENSVRYSFWRISFPPIAISIVGFLFSFLLMKAQITKTKDKEKEIIKINQIREDEKEICNLAAELLGEHSYLLNTVYYFNKCAFVCYFSKAFELHFKKEIAILGLENIGENKEKQAKLASLKHEYEKFAQEYKDNIEQRNKANERLQDSFRKFHTNVGRYSHININSKIVDLYNASRKFDFEIDPNKAVNIADGLKKDSLEIAILNLPNLLMPFQAAHVAILDLVKAEYKQIYKREL